MRKDKALQILHDIMSRSKQNEDDPIVVTRDEDGNLKPVKMAFYMIFNGENVINLDTTSASDDALTLSKLIQEIESYQYGNDFDRLILDINHEVNNLKVSIIDDLIVVVEVE
jgi:hypothetical protein